MSNSRIQILKADITTIKCDAIVNAANSGLLGGGGVDGAIHRAAGRELKEACRLLDGCETGKAKITEGFRLQAKFIIHTVGPVWRSGNFNEAELLKSCYIESLNLAVAHNCKTIAFPNISTGIYGFPKEEAARIALGTVSDFLATNNLPEIVLFTCFDSENLEIYQRVSSGA
ncbi:MAG: O-acetyl-ADP-ribose deacetylase [Lentimicrobium sp.]|nr:O-acetyl-ADP-ribose deacetylase [Lentimicrobium sp.]